MDSVIRSVVNAADTAAVEASWGDGPALPASSEGTQDSAAGELPPMYHRSGYDRSILLLQVTCDFLMGGTQPTYQLF